MYCIFDGWRGVDTTPITGGARTYRRTDANSCPTGTDILVLRTHAIASKARARYGTGVGPGGIYGIANGCGGCGSHAMNSGSAAQTAHWRSVGPSTGAPDQPWYLRSNTYTEPNGDYTQNCWLYLSGWSEGTGYTLNDGSCSYSYTSYVCSTNEWVDLQPPSSPPLL